MRVDDDTQTTLSKWPFILGDILLVSTALAIAILGNWKLTDWQVASCVIAVALGAALFVLPYIVEFRIRIQEEQNDRDAQLRALERHILTAEQTIDGIDNRIRTLESSAASPKEHNAALADLIDQKLAQLERHHAEQNQVITMLKDQLMSIPKSTPPAFDPCLLTPLKERLDALEKLQTEPAKEPPQQADTSSHPVKTGSSSDNSKKVTENKAPQIERPKRSVRKRHGPETSSLLKRAITEKQDSSSTAVSRIIESKAPEADQPPKPQEAQPKTPEPEPETTNTPPEINKAEAPAQTLPEKTTPKTEVETKTPPKEAPQDDALDLDAQVPALDSSDMLFDEDTLSYPVKKTRTKKNDTVLTASVFIGIGNKPYLRGSDGGLSWETGIAMEFVEIGKWRWIAPSDLNQPIEVQLYRNDEDPDKSGTYKLEPGQKLEVSPVF